MHIQWDAREALQWIRLLPGSQIIIIVGFIERKIDTNPRMRLNPRRERRGTDMGRHLKSTRQGITNVGVCQPEQVSL